MHTIPVAAQLSFSRHEVFMDPINTRTGVQGDLTLRWLLTGQSIIRNPAVTLRIAELTATLRSMGV